MTPNDAPAYASAAHAARLIGRDERTVQLWMKGAGYAGERIAGAGYPVALLCEVVNRQKWPGKFTLTPEHFNSDTGPTEDSDEIGPYRPNENTAALAVYGKLDAMERHLARINERDAAMAAELAELREKVGRLLEDIERRRERDEKAAERSQDAQQGVLAALERIERGQRRKGLWARIFGR